MTTTTRIPGWLIVPPQIRDRMPKLVGGTANEIHRSHLPILPPDLRSAILAANPPLHGPPGAIRSGNNILRPYQEEAAKFIRERHGSVLAFQMGCVAGETIVRVNRAGAGRPYRVDVLWQRLHDPDRDRSHLWDPAIPTFVRALCDGELRLHRLVDVVAKGKRPVVKLTLASGKSIRLTDDHEVGMADGSWKPAGELVPGMLVLSDGEGGIGGNGGLVRFIPVEDAVVSVVPDGEADVYDLVMNDPHRNFVANGIVVHNCGKTRTALAATYAPSQPGVIIAPLVAWSVWKKEIEIIYGRDYPVYEVRGRRLTDGFSLTRPGIYLLNPEIARARCGEWTNTRLAYCILDEAHLYINRRAQRHMGAYTIASRADHRVALTGTPVLRHVVDLHGILRCVTPGAFGSWYDFAIDLGGTHGKFGGVQLGVVPKAAMERLEARLTDVMVRRRWEDVTAHVPPLQREMLPVSLSHEDARIYNRLTHDVRLVLGNRVTYATLLQAAKLLEVSTLRRFIGRAKVKAVVDLVCSTVEPVVVWTWHRDVAETIAHEINKRGDGPAAVVTGEDSREERDATIARFQQGAFRVIACTMSSAGLGIDFTRARLSVFAELSWTPGEMAQAEARVFRSGQLRPCVTYWPVVSDTIEERILDVLLEKDSHAKSGALDGLDLPAKSNDAVLSSVVDLVGIVVGTTPTRGCK